MQVKYVMTPGVEMVCSDATVSEAAMKMKSLDIGVLPVQEDDRIIGMVTGRDIIVRAIAEARDPSTTRVDEIMTGEVASCYEDDSIDDAARIMEDKQIHRLMVLSSDNNPVGILALSDIAVKTSNEHLAWEVLERVCEPACPRR